MSSTNKQRRVKAEESRLMDLFAGADQNQLDFIKKHVQQLAWTNVSIVDLQQQIDKEGTVIPFQNGKNQSGMQQNPACKLLIDFQKLSNTSFRALLPVLPEKPRTSKLDAWLRSQQELIDGLFMDDDEDPEERAERDREYEERRKKAEEDFQRAVELQRKEREQREQAEHKKGVNHE